MEAGVNGLQKLFQGMPQSTVPRDCFRSRAPRRRRPEERRRLKEERRKDRLEKKSARLKRPRTGVAPTNHHDCLHTRVRGARSRVDSG